MQEPIRYLAVDYAVASLEALRLLMDETDQPRTFQEIFAACQGRVEVLRLLYEHPFCPAEVKEQAAQALKLPVKSATELEAVKQRELARRAEVKAEARALSLQQRIQRLGVAERIRLALRGGKEVRTVLLKDPNKQVILAVLENPKITESEVEAVARSRHVPEEALRTVAKNREWMRSYSILLALVTNPKTPAGVSMGFISRLKQKDLQLLEKNKNVAEALRAAAKKLLSAKKAGR